MGRYDTHFCVTSARVHAICDGLKSIGSYNTSEVKKKSEGESVVCFRHIKEMEANLHVISSWNTR